MTSFTHRIRATLKFMWKTSKRILVLRLSPCRMESGVFIAKSTDSRHFFVFGHPEYDTDTLAEEYFRDVKKGIDPEVPKHYFPNDDPTQKPLSNWRAAAQLLYTNWLNYYVYQATPYDIDNTDLEAD